MMTQGVSVNYEFVCFFFFFEELHGTFLILTIVGLKFEPTLS
jgi:hypothetical protein